jgi:hypothetical protein
MNCPATPSGTQDDQPAESGHHDRRGFRDDQRRRADARMMSGSVIRWAAQPRDQAIERVDPNASLRAANTRRSHRGLRNLRPPLRSRKRCEGRRRFADVSLPNAITYRFAPGLDFSESPIRQVRQKMFCPRNEMSAEIAQRLRRLWYRIFGNLPPICGSSNAEPPAETNVAYVEAARAISKPVEVPELPS